ncbi:MAG: ABC transporter substrate-binding protein [Verrucomicrobia bacterium]|nr:ABC transporter substrate-binding protein [Verrucomicrobiota bacterium]
MSRLRFLPQTLAIGTLILASLVAPAFSHAQAGKPVPEKPKVRIAVGGKIGFFYLPVSVAEGLGYLKDEGLEPEFSDFAGGAKALQALVGGSADVTSGAYEHTVQMRAKGIALKTFVLQGAYTDIALGIVKGKIPNYKSAADLKGKKYGVTSPGSATDFFVKHQLIKAGLKADDAQVIGIGQTAAAVAAAMHGELDAVSNVDPVMTELEMRGIVEIVADGRTPEGSQAIFGGTFPAGSLYAKEEFIKANPKTVQALTNAIVRALLWMQTATPAQVLEVLPPAFVSSGNRDTVLAALQKTLPTYSRDGQVPKEGADTVLRVQSEIDPAVRDAKINVADTYDNSFAQKALAAYAK